MIIVARFLNNITKNMVLGNTGVHHIYGCRCCGYVGMLHRHGHYSRFVITLFQVFSMDIYRFKCPICKKTYSCLPHFLIPYFRYSYDFILFCLYYIIRLSKPINQCACLLKEINHDCYVSKQSVTYFKKRFYSILPRVNYFFARFPAFYYDMDILEMVPIKAAQTIVMKIMRFDSLNCSFNHAYYSKEKVYFFST